MTLREEERIAEWVKESARRGFGKTAEQVREGVKQVLEEKRTILMAIARGEHGGMVFCEDIQISICCDQGHWNCQERQHVRKKKFLGGSIALSAF